MAKLTDADALRFKASEPVTGAAPSEALMAFQTAFQTAKAAYMAAMKGNERLACLQGLGTIQNMTAALAGLAPEHADNLSAIGSKAMRLLPVIKSEAVKEDVLHKARFEKGKPADPTKHMSDEDADKWKAMNDEHKDNFKSAVSKVALSIMERLQLLSAFQVLSMGGSKAYGVSRDDALSAIERITGKHLIQDAKPPHGKSIEGYLEWLDSQGAVADGDKTASWKSAAGPIKHIPAKGNRTTLCGHSDIHDDNVWMNLVDDVEDSNCRQCVAAWEKAHGGHRSASDVTSKLMSRQEKILKDYRAGGGKVDDYDDLPDNVRAALAKVKDQETLWSDVNRWLGDNR